MHRCLLHPVLKLTAIVLVLMLLTCAGGVESAPESSADGFGNGMENSAPKEPAEEAGMDAPAMSRETGGRTT